MLTITELETAAFWDEVVCPDCGWHGALEDTYITSDEGVECPVCGALRVVPAKTALELHEWVEGLEDAE
jgi:DNA-directed RNA polymerase subunit RPC12/RpoP